MRILFIIVLLLPLIGRASGESFESAKSVALVMEKSDFADCYLKCEFFPFYETQHSKTLQSCFSNTPSPSATPFDLVIKINKTGVVQQTWVNTATNISSCLNAGILASKFPVPPRDDFYVLIQMQFEP